MMFNMQTISAIIATLVAVSSPASVALQGNTHRRARQTCTDKAGWHDAGGKEFDYAWYANTVNACIDYGADEQRRSNVGLVANDACCACGGGDRTTTAHPQPNPTNGEIAGQQCGVDMLESSLALTKAVNDHHARNGKPRLPITIARMSKTLKTAVGTFPMNSATCAPGSKMWKVIDLMAVVSLLNLPTQNACGTNQVKL